MQRKKIAACICALSLVASLFAADILPVFGASVPEESAGGIQQEKEEFEDAQMTWEENAESDNNSQTEKRQPEEERENPDTGKEPDGTGEELQNPGEGKESDETGEKPKNPGEGGESNETEEGLQNPGDTEKEPENSGETEEGPMFFSAPEPGEGQEPVPDAPKPGEGQESVPEVSEPDEGRIYVDGVLYSGYYMDGSGMLHLVSNGVAEPFSGTVSEGAEYYSGTDKKVVKLPRQTVYVEGKVYTGYYLENDIFYTVSNGTAEVKSGTVAKGAKYYSCGDHGVATLKEQTVFVAGKAYTGYYLDSRNKMFKVKNGIRTLHTGMVKAKTQYYSYKEGKTKNLSKKTLYVKGKLYTGYYMNSEKKLYKAKNGICTLHTGTVKAGKKYYNYNTEKKKKLSKDTVYVKGKVYTGYYLDSKKRMYYVKKGTRTLQTGIMNTGTKYYSYNGKKTKKLSKDTLYVKGKVYTGYYLDNENIMYSVNNGTCTPVNAALNAGTGYYSFKEGKMTALSKTTVYINGKAMEGMSPESLATLQRAQAVVSSITNDGMTREEKLRICFDYVKEAYPEIKPRIPHYLGMDWPVIYANDMFVNGAGNCCSYAAAFAYMAKAIGYEEVYCCNSGGHGWAEIDGLVYDPEWSKWHHVYNYYALSYDTKTDQNYKGAIGAGKPWMRIKI